MHSHASLITPTRNMHQVMHQIMQHTMRRMAKSGAGWAMAVAVGLCLVLATAPAAAKPSPPGPAPVLTTEAQLQDPAQAAALEAFWQQGGTPLAFLTGAGGLQLAWRAFVQADRRLERGAIVLVSGRTETMLKAKELVHDLWRNGWSVYLYDHRGQGLSQREPAVATAALRQHGDVGRFDDYVDDLRAFVRGVVQPAGHHQHGLLAHSMGGAIAALLLEAGGPQAALFGAAALMSPMLAITGLLQQPADYGLCSAARGATLIGLGASYLPGGGDWRDKGATNNPYTSSPVRYARFMAEYQRNDAVRLGSATLRWTAEACDAAARARAGAARLRLPLLLVIGADDRIVHSSGARTFCAAVRQANPARGCGGEAGGPLVLPGGRHELLIEADAIRNMALTRVLQFFETYLAK